MLRFMMPAMMALVVLAGVLAGCTSKATARAQAQAAYLAGQQSAAARLPMRVAPVVTVMGNARRQVVDWAEGLTLAEALVAAEYEGPTPQDIVIRRGDQRFNVRPDDLLSGRDFVLQKGDVIEVHP